MFVCNKYLLKLWRLFGSVPFQLEIKGVEATIVGTNFSCVLYSAFLLSVHSGFFVFTVLYYDSLRTRKDIADASSNAMYYIIWLLAMTSVIEALHSRKKMMRFFALIKRIDDVMPSNNSSRLFLILPFIVYIAYGYIQYVRFVRYPTFLNACYDLGNLIIFTSQMYIIFIFMSIKNRQITLNRTILMIYTPKPELSVIFNKSKEVASGGPNLPKIFWLIHDLVEIANSALGYRNLSYFLHTFMFIIFHLYYSVVDMLKDGSALFFLQHLIFLSISFILMIKTSTTAAAITYQQHMTEAICKKISLNNLTKDQSKQISLILSTIPTNCVELNCLGLFTLMPPVITAMIGTVTTYCIIITQFELSIK